MGHRLAVEDRVALCRLVTEVLSSSATGVLELSVLPGETASRAVVVLAADGLPAPRVGAGGTLVVERPTRWWYDVSLRCEAGTEPQR